MIYLDFLSQILIIRHKFKNLYIFFKIIYIYLDYFLFLYLYLLYFYPKIIYKLILFLYFEFFMYKIKIYLNFINFFFLAKFLNCFNILNLVIFSINSNY